MIQMQKVIKVGNSLALTLDSKQAALMNITAGQELAAAYNSTMGIVSFSRTKQGLADAKITEKEAVMAGKITPELKQWTDKFLFENEEAMKKLADL